MTQLWPEGAPVDVEMSDDRPHVLRWQGRRHLHRAAGEAQVAHVHSVTDRWLIHDDGWRDEIWRHYFQLQTTDGLLCVVYRDMLRDTWYMERIYD